MDVAFLERGACMRSWSELRDRKVDCLMGVSMRLATVVLFAFTMVGGTSEASNESAASFRVSHAAVVGEGSFIPPTERFVAHETRGGTPTPRSAANTMGLVPAQMPPSFTRSLPFDHSSTEPARPYHPANIPLPAARTLEDHLLTGFVALMLIAYQLRRKHRFLRPHQFST